MSGTPFRLTGSLFAQVSGSLIKESGLLHANRQQCEYSRPCFRAGCKTCRHVTSLSPNGPPLPTDSLPPGHVMKSTFTVIDGMEIFCPTHTGRLSGF
ncbi:hypothetical protein AGOR_G00038880 [Albula goreensis]|uniref:Uncharacterized protein n=1 Tax=Albula goreensis TaxID=1534307 RepID=A0A8T3DWY3_9TELE|nr:hypothetical protein AGOR_G00038880 [Albula goreensis]